MFKFILGILFLTNVLITGEPPSFYTIKRLKNKNGPLLVCFQITLLDNFSTYNSEIRFSLHYFVHLYWGEITLYKPGIKMFCTTKNKNKTDYLSEPNFTPEHDEIKNFIATFDESNYKSYNLISWTSTICIKYDNSFTSSYFHDDLIGDYLDFSPGTVYWILKYTIILDTAEKKIKVYAEIRSSKV